MHVYLVLKSQLQVMCSRVSMLQCLTRRSTMMVPFKVVHNRKALVFELENSTSLNFLQRKIREMLKIKIHESFDVYWIDYDNDRILLDSDEVLKIVLKAFQKQNNSDRPPIIKLNIIIQRGVKVLVEEACPSPIIKKESKQSITHNYNHEEMVHC